MNREVIWDASGYILAVLTIGYSSLEACSKIVSLLPRISTARKELISGIIETTAAIALVSVAMRIIAISANPDSPESHKIINELFSVATAPDMLRMFFAAAVMHAIGIFLFVQSAYLFKIYVYPRVFLVIHPYQGSLTYEWVHLSPLDIARNRDINNRLLPTAQILLYRLNKRFLHNKKFYKWFKIDFINWIFHLTVELLIGIIVLYIVGELVLLLPIEGVFAVFQSMYTPHYCHELIFVLSIVAATASVFIQRRNILYTHNKVDKYQDTISNIVLNKYY